MSSELPPSTAMISAGAGSSVASTRGSGGAGQGPRPSIGMTSDTSPMRVALTPVRSGQWARSSGRSQSRSRSSSRCGPRRARPARRTVSARTASVPPGHRVKKERHGRAEAQQVVAAVDRGAEHHRHLVQRALGGQQVVGGQVGDVGPPAGWPGAGTRASRSPRSPLALIDGGDRAQPIREARRRLVRGPDDQRQGGGLDGDDSALGQPAVDVGGGSGSDRGDQPRLGQARALDSARTGAPVGRSSPVRTALTPPRGGGAVEARTISR